MKFIVFLFIVLLIQVKSDYLRFGQQAVNVIFKDKKDALVLFTTVADTQASAQFIKAAQNNVGHVFTTVDKDQNKEYYSRFAQYLGINIQKTPILIYLVQSKKKYIGDVTDLSPEKMAGFIEKVKAGQIKPFLKSAPIPKQQTGPVKTIVGDNFKQAVLDTQKQILLKIYTPWCGHCKTLAPHFDAAAQALAHNPNIILANFDGTLNEAQGIEVQGYPTLYWYGKNKNEKPIVFNEQRDKQGILKFIKDHTQYDWVVPNQLKDEEL